jgi:hypothetical protein
MSESSFKFNPEIDHTINVARLQEDCINFPSILYHYCTAKADAEEAFEASKLSYEEAKATVYLLTKQGADKITEKHLEAIITTDHKVLKAKETMLKAKRDFETIKGYVDSLRAKKDMLVQLSADMRSERNM